MRLSIGILSAFLAGTDALECISCTHTKNSLGETDGALGNPKCWDEAESLDTFKQCDGTETCLTEMHVKWDPYGKQLYTIARGCGEKPVDSSWHCYEDPLPNFQTKDCLKWCEGERCNFDMSIQDLFTSANNQEYCEACRYHELDDGEEQGNSKCKDKGAGTRIDCPKYANYGCYTASTSHNTADGKLRKDAYRGCSAFMLEDTSCTTFEINDDSTGETSKYGACKEVCFGPSCNNKQPTEPDLTAEYPTCQVCSETQDAEGNMLGSGDGGCFDGDAKFETKCARVTDKCAVEMKIDWFPKGDHAFQVNRRCAPTEPTKPCIDGSSELVQYKDCVHICEGDGCNSDNEGVGQLISVGTVGSCYTCKWVQTPDGQVDGNKHCGDMDRQVSKENCPLWADASCSTAASYHRDYQTTNDEREDDYRGCSPFVLPEDSWEHCGSASINGLDHVNCKSTCTKDNCNDQPTSGLGSKRLQCFSCSATRDSEGNPVGVTDDSCFDTVKADYITECSIGSYCKDEMLIDWFPTGRQQITIMRGCYTPPDQDIEPKPLCSESSSSSLNFQFRDCTHYCDSSLCNVGMEVGELQGSPNGQDVCQVCSYVENDEGDREGFPPCLDSSSPGKDKACPVYATHGCYMANSIHTNADGDRKKEIYRGCSSFEHEFRDCYEHTVADENGEDNNWGICKEFCTGTNCNNKQPASPEQGNNWPSCLVCDAVVDNDNNTVGMGSHDCWDLDADHPELSFKYLQRCPNQNDKCITEMLADWLPRGNVQYLVTRYCANEAAPRFCTEGSSSLVQYKDCKTSCNPLADGPGCNEGLEKVGSLFALNNVETCQSCSYYQDQVTGGEIGNDRCRNPSGNSFRVTCPTYATGSCFEAASFHANYNGGNEVFEEDYRGCSPFVTEGNNEETRCTDMDMNDIVHTNCRRNCYDDGCNTEPLTRGTQCYSCSGNRDGQGNPIGVGDDDCFENVGKKHLIECGIDEDHCVDEMLVDWLPKGNQIATIMRGCAKASEIIGNIPCYEGEGSGGLRYKDCHAFCENNDGACNDGTEVFDDFRPPRDNVYKCIGCMWEQHDDGSVGGNFNCLNNADQTEEITCPNYATTACFSAEAIHNDYGQSKVQVYKGCSSFGIPDANGGVNGIEKDSLTLPDDNNNVVGYSTVKQTCDRDSCNNVHEHAQPPNAIGSSFCQVCSVTVNMYNNTVGVGQNGCWFGDASYNQECGVGQYCSTELETDWLPKGEVQYRLVRGCTTSLTPAPCHETYTPYYAHKDCDVKCNPMESGQGCNKGLEEVARRFDAGDLAVGSCYTCHYFQTINGEESGIESCKKEIDTNAPIPRMTCPMYANQGCFHAASYHLDYADNNKEFEDDYRGCSPFVSPNGHPPTGNNNHPRYTCHNMELNGLDHENCKSVCADDDCNTRASRARPMCYTCQGTFDSAGFLVGVGDDRCWDLRGGDHMILNCPRDMPHCMTEMQVDWKQRGEQQVTLRRGCAKYEAPEECYQQESEKTKYKDCYDSCPATSNGTACNDNLEVMNKFTKGQGAPQMNCYSCKYTETSNGDVLGNKACFDAPLEEHKTKCQIYNSRGCYSGGAVHIQNGVEKEEVYKGCSTFEIEGGIEKVENAEVQGVPYSLVKQTCKGEHCNVGHEKPSRPKKNVENSNDTINRATRYFSNDVEVQS